MSNLFSGMEAFGLGKISKNIDIYEDKDSKAEKKQKKESERPQMKEEDVLFDKTMVCPVCDGEIKVKTVKTGKVKLLEMDTDLRPKYQLVDTLKYDAIVCPHCGYASLRRFFESVTKVQTRLIKENISANFKGIAEPAATYSYDDAINRHKLALLSSIVKKAKVSEKAYICLKIAWLLRGKRESYLENETTSEEVVEKLLSEEQEFIQKSYDGFREAFTKENFPICGMDEMTCTYLVADLAIRCKDYDEAGRYISSILVSRSANDRIKDKARALKEIIHAEKGEE